MEVSTLNRVLSAIVDDETERVLLEMDLTEAPKESVKEVVKVEVKEDKQ
jgi:hypothetical protein